MKKTVWAWAAVALLGVTMLAGCRENKDASQTGEAQQPAISADSPADFPVEVNGLTIETVPQKVVVLSPSLAEVVSDMGLSAALCGRAEECDYPEAVAALPAVGGMLVPDVEAVAGLQPDFVLMQSQPTEELARQFEEKGIKVLVIPAATGWEDLGTMYEAVGKAFAGAETGPTTAESFVKTMLEEPMAQVMQALGTQAGTLRALYAADGSGSAATGDTLIGALLEKAGAVNAAQADTGWKISAETAAAAEVIFCPEEMVDTVKNAEIYVASPAVQNGRVYGVDAAALERQGQRMVQAVQSMAGLLYPEAFAVSSDAPAA